MGACGRRTCCDSGAAALGVVLVAEGVLVSDEIMECSKNILKYSCKSDEYSVAVSSVLRLINETLPALSEGWADGLLCVWIGMWTIALAMSAVVLDRAEVWAIFIMIAVTCIPLLLAYDVAHASSDW